MGKIATVHGISKLGIGGNKGEGGFGDARFPQMKS